MKTKVFIEGNNTDGFTAYIADEGAPYGLIGEGNTLEETKTDSIKNKNVSSAIWILNSSQPLHSTSIPKHLDFGMLLLYIYKHTRGRRGLHEARRALFLGRKLANSDYEVNSSKETDDNFSQRKQNSTIWGDDNKSPKKSIWE